MSQYIDKLGIALSEVLERAAEAQPAQFCGYWANIEFWFSELEHLVSITDGYEERLRAMHEAHDQQIKKEPEVFNKDEFGKPFQAVKATTRRGDRKRLIGRAKSAFVRLTDRALEMSLIGMEDYDNYTQRLKFVEPITPSEGD